jgi:hypothetical protein
MVELYNSVIQLVLYNEMNSIDSLKTTFVYDSKEEAVAKLEEFKDPSWRVLKCDDLENALMGCCVIRCVNKSMDKPVVLPENRSEIDLDNLEVQEYCIQYRMFNKPIVCDSYHASVKLLVELIKTRDVPVMLCDVPELRQVGFIWFYPDKDMSILNRITLTELKCANEEDRNFICELRNKLMDQQNGLK